MIEEKKQEHGTPSDKWRLCLESGASSSVPEEAGKRVNNQINMCSCFDQNLVPSHLDIVLSS